MPLRLSDDARADLGALADRIIPRGFNDPFPSATEAGFYTFFDRNAADLAEALPRLEAGLGRLAEQCASFGSSRFADLPIDAQDAVMEACAASDPGFVGLVESLVAQSYYSDTHDSRTLNRRKEAHESWRMIGYDPAPKRAYAQVDEAPLRVTSRDAIAREYDAIVVGSGAGGGIVACELAEAGLSVVLLERGDALTFAGIGRDHLRNHRFPAYGHNTGPDLDGHPRVFDRGDRTYVPRPFDALWHNNAMTVGGGTRVWGAQAWRFAPQDFAMASTYGVPEGSSLADWPFGYTDLAPYYARAEAEIGVCGKRGHRHEGERGDYPMDPLPDTAEAGVLGNAARHLGWTVGPVPLAINSRTYLGRPACVACGQCVGFACPSNSKNGSFNTVIPRALATGRCALVTRAQVLRVVTDNRGQARGVEVMFDGASPFARYRAGLKAPPARYRAALRAPISQRIDAPLIVLAAGAIETARLLLASRSNVHPHGLGNTHDQVGRNLQGHLYAGASGIATDDIQQCVGPGVAIATCEFNHGNPGIIGGGMLANEFVPLPIHYWSTFYPRDLPRRGLAAKRAFAQAYRRRLVVMGPIQEIPNPRARVTLDPTVTDKWGMPVARLEGAVHTESIRAAAMLRTKAQQWLEAAGATHLMAFAPRAGVLSGGQHQAGTCRMGADPASSVTDATGRVHGQRSLYVADASLHVTNGGYNPALTVMANALRIASALARKR